jgi:putative transcription factor
MSCEICGSLIKGIPSHVVVEGARLVVCAKCSTHGEECWEPVAPSKTPERPIPKQVIVKPKKPADSLPKAYAELELCEDYAIQIRRARERRGFTQEDLAKRAKEKLSIIQKIELGKMIPNLQLARTLEHVLKIKLLVPLVEPKTPNSIPSEAEELTIGDIIQFKKRDEQEKHRGIETK